MSRQDEKDRKRRNLARAWAEEQDKSGGPSCINPPEGVDILKLNPTGKEPLRVDVVPFIAGKNNPRADEGEEAIERTYDLHWVPGMSGRNQPVACRQACFGKRCAVCDWLRNNGGKADEELVKSLRSKTRHLWLVNDKPGDKKPSLKLLDTTDKNRGQGFAELMSDAITALGEDVDPFALEDGYTAYIIVKEQTMGDGRKYNAATRIDLRPRSHSYPASMLKNNPCLDECIVDPGYDEVMKTLEPGDPHDDDESPARGKKASRDDDEDDMEPSKNGDDKGSDEEPELEAGDKVMYEDMECIIKRISSDGSLVLEDENGGVTKGVQPDEVEKVVEKPKPAKPAKRGKPEPEPDEDEDEEGDSDLEEEEKEPDEDEDEEGDSDLEEEEEAPPPKKPVRRK